MKKVLVFSFSFIGDAVLSTAVIHPLRSHFPNSHITFLVGPFALNVFANDPQMDAVLVYDNREKHAGLRGRLQLMQSLRRGEFDLVVNLRDSFAARCIGAEHWGLVRGNRERHAVTRYLEVLSRQGVDTTAAQPQLQLTEAEHATAQRFLADADVRSGQLLMGIHPGGNWVYKLWSVEKYAQLGSILCQEQKAAILLFAGPNERGLQAQVAGMMGKPPILVETENLREVAALIATCDVYIGNDTGPMHIAAAVGTPVVALFGSTNQVRSGPYGEMHSVVHADMDLGCNPCHPGRHPGGCGAGSCAVMDGISVERVLETVSLLRLRK